MVLDAGGHPRGRAASASAPAQVPRGPDLPACIGRSSPGAQKNPRKAWYEYGILGYIMVYMAWYIMVYTYSISEHIQMMAYSCRISEHMIGLDWIADRRAAIHSASQK